MAGLGYPIIRLTLSDQLRKEFGGVLLLPVGYLILCLGAFVLSGSFGLTARLSTLIVSIILWVITVSILIIEGKSYLEKIKTFKKNIAFIAVLMIPIQLLMFWPLFINGSDTFIGANNPDYFAGLIDNYFLLNGNGVSDFTKGSNTYFPLDYLAGSISSSGRFASGLFAISIEILLGVDTREALTLSIALFLSCLPLSIYFFSRTIFGLDVKTSTLSGWLIGLSAPTALSYLYFYLGQNSGLPALPLTMAVGFLLITQPSIKLLILFSLLANALFVTYLGMLPYVVAPLGILALYYLLTSCKSFITIFGLLLGFLGISFVINFGMLREIYAMVMGWSNVIGQSLQGQYFLDFLTEQFFSLFLGVMAYPLQSTWYYSTFGYYGLPIVLILTLMVIFFIFISLLRWIKKNDSHDRLIVVISAVVIYAIVWWVYTMQRQYGYAVFKMTSWLQFMLIPIAAFGISQCFRMGKLLTTGFKAKAVVICASIYVLTNMFATIGYGIKAMGFDTKYGSIVNNYEMSGNRDYFEVSHAINKYVRLGESVGISFVDSIQNFWLAYYLKDNKISILSHENIPGDDENLPGIFDNNVTDYYGRVHEANNVFFHGAEDEYYLTWNKNHINRDIVDVDFLSKPLWENSTFRLFTAKENPDMAFTGRGFYRTEYLREQKGWGFYRNNYSKEQKGYWWPDVMRWTAEGGEIYLLRPSQKGRPYVLKLDAIVGLENEADSRTLELWANKVKFDEYKINSSARYISKPFIPNDEVTKIVIKIKEKVGTTNRPLPLWNKEIPADYRQLNLSVSNVKIYPVNTEQKSVKCGTSIQEYEILNCAKWFNGIQIDRWIGKNATLAIVNSMVKDSSAIEIKGFLPGNLDFNFPFKISFYINGKEFQREISSPGEFFVEFPLQKTKLSDLIEVTIEPEQAFELKNQLSLRRKIVTQSLRLDAVNIK
jgi:hypothetical protein